MHTLNRYVTLRISNERKQLALQPECNTARERICIYCSNAIRKSQRPRLSATSLSLPEDPLQFNIQHWHLKWILLCAQTSKSNYKNPIAFECRSRKEMKRRNWYSFQCNCYAMQITVRYWKSTCQPNTAVNWDGFLILIWYSFGTGNDIRNR